MEIDLASLPDKKYFSMGEASNLLGVRDHILRYWEKEFDALEPTKRTGNRRYYSQNDILTILKIHELISVQGFTIDGAKQKISSPSDGSSQDNQTLSLIKKDIQKIIDVLDK